MRNTILRSVTSLLTLVLGIGVSAITAYSQQILSVSKQQEKVVPSNSQACETVSIDFSTNVRIVGANLRMVGPSGNIFTLVSLDATNPFCPDVGLEGRTGDLLFGEASGPGVSRTGANNDTNKDVFFPGLTGRVVPKGTKVYIHTFDDVGDTGGDVAHVEIIFYAITS